MSTSKLFPSQGRLSESEDSAGIFDGESAGTDEVGLVHYKPHSLFYPAHYLERFIIISIEKILSINLFMSADSEEKDKESL